MKKNNFEEMSKRIIELAGGIENIRKVSHCFTIFPPAQKVSPLRE